MADGWSIFRDFDMALVVGQATINRQIARMAAAGDIRTKVVLVQKDDGASYELLDDPAAIPKQSGGTPALPCLDAAIMPRLQIDKTGTDAVFMLDFVSGEAWFWIGDGPRAVLTRFDCAGWSYGVVVTLDLRAAEAESPGADPRLKAQLERFTGAMFDVSALFLDLASVTLERFQAAPIATPGAPAAAKPLSLFMTWYLNTLKASGQKTVLGYTVTASERTRQPAELAVPDTLLPTGATFTLVHNEERPEESVLVYALATKGCHGRVGGAPIDLDSRCFGGPPPADGALMVYGPGAFAEPVIIRPIFDQLRDGVWAQIKDKIGVPAGQDWKAARTVQPNGGWSFNICNFDSELDRYRNSFVVVPELGAIRAMHRTAGPEGDDEPPDGAALDFRGEIHVFKKHSTNVVFGRAETWAWSDIAWSGFVTFLVSSDARLLATGKFKAKSSSGSDHNVGGAMLAALGDVIGGIAGALTGGLDGGVIGGLFKGLLGGGAPDLGGLPASLRNFQTAAQAVVLTPTGDRLQLQGATIGPGGEVVLNCSYLPADG